MEGDVFMSELDMYHTIQPDEILRNPDQKDRVKLKDFASGMSSIAVGIKPHT